MARLFGIAVDIQVVVGAALFLSLSPLTTIAPSTTATRLSQDSRAYFFAVIHPALMFVGFVAVHVASVLVRRGQSDALRVRRALIFYGITWLLVVVGTPSWRPWIRV